MANFGLIVIALLALVCLYLLFVLLDCFGVFCYLVLLIVDLFCHFTDFGFCLLI